MCKLYFQYGAMGAGKSLELIKVAYNYTERGRRVLIFNSKLDNRFDEGSVASRSGSRISSFAYDESTDLLQETLNKNGIDCVLIDESQFLSEKQVDQCSHIVTKLDIPVMCFGLKTDFKGKLFEGSKRLLEIAQKIEEIKTICWCGKKATMNARINEGKMVTDGEQIEIGLNEKYISLCLKHYLEKKIPQ